MNASSFESTSAVSAVSAVLAVSVVSKDVRRAFVRSASRLLPRGGWEESVKLFETCSKIYAGLEERYFGLRTWPWDGQVSLILTGWVMGPGFRLEKFQEAACRYAPDFQEMSRQCVFDHRGHTGVISLGGMVRAGFKMASDVVLSGTSRKKLYCNW